MLRTRLVQTPKHPLLPWGGLRLRTVRRNGLRAPFSLSIRRLVRDGDGSETDGASADLSAFIVRRYASDSTLTPPAQDPAVLDEDGLLPPFKRLVLGRRLDELRPDRELLKRLGVRRIVVGGRNEADGEEREDSADGEEGKSEADTETMTEAPTPRIRKVEGKVDTGTMPRGRAPQIRMVDSKARMGTMVVAPVPRTWKVKIKADTGTMTEAPAPRIWKHVTKGDGMFAIKKGGEKRTVVRDILKEVGPVHGGLPTRRNNVDVMKDLPLFEKVPSNPNKGEAVGPWVGGMYNSAQQERDPSQKESSKPDPTSSSMADEFWSISPMDFGEETKLKSPAKEEKVSLHSHTASRTQTKISSRRRQVRRIQLLVARQVQRLLPGILRRRRRAKETRTARIQMARRRQGTLKSAAGSVAAESSTTTQPESKSSQPEPESSRPRSRKQRSPTPPSSRPSTKKQSSNNSLLMELFPEQATALPPPAEPILDEEEYEDEDISVPRIPLPSTPPPTPHKSHTAPSIPSPPTPPPKPTNDLAVLEFRSNNPCLTPDDFRRLIPRPSTSDWAPSPTTDFITVFPRRDPWSLQRDQGTYYLVFASPAAAKAYQAHVMTLAHLVRLHTPTSLASAPPPPPGALTRRGIDVGEALATYALDAARDVPHLTLLNTPFSAHKAALFAAGGYAQVVGQGRAGLAQVLLSFTGPQPSYGDLWDAIGADGKGRGVGWGLWAPEPLIAVDMAPVGREAEQGGGGRRWIVAFGEGGEAGRFVRTWHRRLFPWPGRRQFETVVEAEVLW
ncbi:hypothetical protein EJ06DRAFT_560158 [Trichodelitschia bisporula]|uniref:Uncharacterized protein n=1 Tax=Trichodelitschia bisporula TaxID=703511 RepID=A0A6G1HKB8_9PEZI|nr:hypothetical protein EJ06DRAFT_560158 [Trichodelitschia bisporula]